MQIISLPIALNAHRNDLGCKRRVEITLKIPYFAFHGDHYPQDTIAFTKPFETPKRSEKTKI